MGFILLDSDKVVIQKQPTIQEFEQDRGFIEIKDEQLYNSIVCGQIRQKNGRYVNPPAAETIEENAIPGSTKET